MFDPSEQQLPKHHPLQPQHPTYRTFGTCSATISATVTSIGASTTFPSITSPTPPISPPLPPQIYPPTPLALPSSDTTSRRLVDMFGAWISQRMLHIRRHRDYRLGDIVDTLSLKYIYSSRGMWEFPSIDSDRMVAPLCKIVLQGGKQKIQSALLLPTRSKLAQQVRAA